MLDRLFMIQKKIIFCEIIKYERKLNLHTKILNSSTYLLIKIRDSRYVERCIKFDHKMMIFN